MPTEGVGSSVRHWLRPAIAALPLLWLAACESEELGSAAVGGARSGGSGGAAGKAGGSGGAPASGAGRPAVGGVTGASGGETGATSGGLVGTGGMLTGGSNAAGGLAGASAGGSVAGGTSGANAGQGGAGAGQAGTGGKGSAAQPVSFTIFDEVVFYDAYANVVSEPVPAGVRRLRNDLFTRKLSDQELNAIQSTLRVRVVIGALCDNYDRIGSVALALAPKGGDEYEPDEVERIEVGRYITPFMDWNRMPDEVSYEYQVNNLVSVLRDPEIRAEHDLWFELELFGVPYAANEEVAGCANRNDVFRGTLILDSDSSAPAPAFDELMPLAYKEPFNDYQQGASDQIGVTRKTIEFTLDADTADTQLVLISSNHGANSGGEEYVRRDHFVFVDGEPVLEYKPGRTSCEPFRKVNTQANGIYGASPRSDSEWQSFSNWCPGDRIDTRLIPLGPMSAGSHELVVDVPDAEFVGDDGNFPLSVYLQSRAQ